MTDSKKPPNKIWFKNTPENVAEFMRRYPDAKNENGNTVADLVKILNGSPFAFYIDETGRIGWCQTEGYLTAFKFAFKFAELDLTPAPKLFPSGYWFANTKENCEAAAKQFPGDSHLLMLLGDNKTASEYGHMYGSPGFAYTKGFYAKEGLTEFKFETKAETKVDLVDLAKKCRGMGLSSSQHSDLAVALINAGYNRLAKAVRGGTKWAEDIAEGKNLEELEVEAGAGHWSWNDVAAIKDRVDPVDAMAEAVKSVQLKRTLQNGEYIVIPKGMAEKAWEEFSDIAGFYDKDTHSGVFMKNATSDVVIWKTGNWFSWTKRETIKDYVKNHKEVTWSGSPTSFAAESEPSLAPIKTTFTSQQSSWYEPSWYKLYCNPLFSSPVSEKESDMSPSEIQTVIDAVTKNLSKSGVVARKPNMASRALGYTWNTTKLATGWVFAPVKKIAQLTICLTALAGIGYGGYRVWNAIPKALPTIQWEQPEVSPSDVRDDGYTLHNVN